MIELKNVSKYYNGNGNVSLGLRNINLNLNKGEIVAIVGESGAGKSTLLNVICGVDTYEDGEIYFEGHETSYFNQEDMDTFRRLNVSFIYQNYNIIDSYTVLENVMLPLLINGKSKQEAKKRALELIDKVGLSKRIKHRGTKLSGGEKQRCVIARALACDSPILACDEPTGNLDSKTGEEIIKLIKEVATDKLVLIVTHNYEQVRDIVTRTITLHDGEVVNDTNPNSDIVPLNEDKDIFDDVPKPKRKTLGLITSYNLKNTPKKNIFSFIVLLVFCFIGFFLYISCLGSKIESEYSSNSSLLNTVRERIVVYDKDHKQIDPSKFNGYEYYTNPFYEDKMVGVRYTSNTTGGYLYCGFTKHMPFKVSDVSGNKDIKNGKYFLVIPYDYSQDLIDTMLSANYGIDDTTFEFSLCGIGVNKEIKRPMVVVDDSAINKIDILEYAKAKAYDANGKLLFDNITVGHYASLEKNRLLVPADTDISSLKIVTGSYEFDVNDFVIEVREGLTEPVLGYKNDVINNNVYELSIYTNNFRNIERICNDNGYSYLYPSKVGSTNFSLSFISFIVQAIFSTILMILLVFISFVVLSRVYQSKKADYGIMRSLGLLKSQMAVIVRYEMLIIGIAASIFAIIIFVIVSLFNPSYAAMLDNASFIFYIFYFAMMIIFNLLLSKRFNKKLFNFSVNKTIKEVF